SWSKNREADLAGYRVYRAASAEGAYELIATTTSAKLSDKAAPAGLTSHYRVTALDRSGNESAPVAVSALRTDRTAPAAPAALTATAGASGIALDWADGTEADLAGYVVLRATGTSSSYRKLTSTPLTASAWTDASAVAGTAYTYRVSALDLSGNTSAAASARGLLRDDVAPAAVRSLKASGSTSSVSLSWSTSREADLAGYRVYRAASAEGAYELIGTPTSAKLSDKAAPAGLPSHYRVTAVDTSGNESAPVAVSALRTDRTAPAAPGALTATATAGGVELDWADAAEADLAGYVVQRATGTSTSFKALTRTPLTASGFTDTTAVPGTRYTYRVAVLDLSGNTSPYTAVAGTLPDTLAPGAVRSLKAKASSSSVALTWSKNGEDDLAGYRVYRAASADGAHELIATTTSAKFTDTTAPAGVFSHYRVTAVDTSGNESAPAAVGVLREDAVAPAAPGAPVVTATADGLALDWPDSAEADLAGYVVQRATGTSTSFTTLTSSALVTSSYTDTRTAPGTSYTYRVRAVDLSGNLSAPATVTAVHPDTTAPAAPRGLGAAPAAGGVQLRWSASTEADLAGYRVYRSSGLLEPFAPLTTALLTSASHLDATAPAGTTSTYRVTAVDTSGNESPVSATATSAPLDTT
ncbi:hypothetical protein GTR00_19935, partial [Kineococcus sp. T90]|nr:hypothetical protein [Kineococcus indalonis]